MKRLSERLQDVVTTAFKNAGIDEKYSSVGISNRPDLCDYQSNGAMAAAKEYHKAPFVIADEIIAKLNELPEAKKYFAKAEAVKPGFLNFTLSPEFMAEYAGQMDSETDFGFEKAPDSKNIVLDYGGPNVAKPLHVGHLRSAIIGESLKRIERFVGNKVTGDVHLGDWGLQMGLIIAELEDRGQLDKDLNISELEEIYPFASKKSKEVYEDGPHKGELVNPEFAERAHEATLKLQSGDPKYHAVWEKIMKVSVEDLKKNYANLNVHFDLWKGESDAEPYIPELIKLLTDKGLAYKSEGALVVDVSEPTDSKEIPPCMIQKSDGAALYSTSDLGTVMDREKNLHPDEYIYIADRRQELHYVQFFRVARKAGLVKPETVLKFIGFGTMNGKDGKPFKTREGGVMRLETLISDITNAVAEKMADRDMPEDTKQAVAKQVGLAALKYGDLSNQAAKDYVFDLDRFASFEGNTGPYIQYTVVRIRSILDKYAESVGKDRKGIEDDLRTVKFTAPAHENEKKLILTIDRFADTLTNVASDLAPHKLCAYIYELANDFSAFYHECPILTESDEARKMSLLKVSALTGKILVTCLDLLGIEAPERM